MTTTYLRTYSEMCRFHTFEERFEYLSLKGQVGESIFGFERWLNQNFYTSNDWRRLRQQIIARDNGMDLGMEGFGIHSKLTIHHINPIRPEDFERGDQAMLDPENLITTTHNTHMAIHYGSAKNLILPPVERRPGDTLEWAPLRGGFRA